MTRFGWLVLGGVVVAILGIALLLWGFARQSRIPGPAQDTAELPAVDPSMLSIYTSGTFGFSVFYPATAVVTDTFVEGEPPSWRRGSTATGTPIVHITTASGEVRIGASSDARARTNCLIEGPSETAAEPATFGGSEWQVFTSDELGTEDERRVVSYRTLHENQCFALETLEPIAEGTTTAPTEDVTFIVRNFTFAR